MSEVLRIGVVGGGLIAQAIHLPRIARLSDRFELVGIVDPSRTVREALCGRYPSARPYDDARRMLDAEAPDCVVVCSPNAAHADVVFAALDAGAHVLVEKPLCVDPADARRICRRSEETGRIVQVGYMKRFDAAYESLLECLPTTGDDLRMIDVVTYDPYLPRAPFVSPDLLITGNDIPARTIDKLRASERDQVEAAVGGVPDGSVRTFTDVYLGALVHDVNLVHGVVDQLGLEFPGTVLGSNHWAGGRAADAYVGLSNGASWHCAWLLLEGLEEFRERASFYFGDAVHELRFSAPYLVEHATLHHVVRAEGDRHRSEVSQRVGDSYLAQLEHFHACIVDGIPCRNTPADAALDIEILRDLFRCNAERHRRPALDSARAA
jgi:predicted dehydrogenase